MSAAKRAQQLAQSFSKTIVEKQKRIEKLESALAALSYPVLFSGSGDCCRATHQEYHRLVREIALAALED